ncbi:MAG: hypothetical protein WCM76_07130 [Bacteroidota bacterium]
MKNCVLPIFVILYFLAAHGQDSVAYHRLDRNYYLAHHDSLMAVYGINKTFEPGSELAGLAALTFYPELKNVSVTFRRHPIITTMSAVPHAEFMRYRKQDRSYFININNRKNFKGIRFDNLNFNQQVGVLGHELGHILYYTSKRSTGLFLFGLGYFFLDFRRNVEAHTDMTAISHELGWQLYEYAHSLSTDPNVSESYKRFKSRFYLNDNELLELVKQHQAKHTH